MVPAFGRLWKFKAPPRILVFGWLALRNRILTMDNLRRRGMVVVDGFPLCLKDEEFVDHLLLRCNFAYRMWTVVLGWFGCSWVLPNSLLDLFEAWSGPSLAPRGKEMWNCHSWLSFGLSRKREMLGVSKGLLHVRIQLPKR